MRSAVYGLQITSVIPFILPSVIDAYQGLQKVTCGWGADGFKARHEGEGIAPWHEVLQKQRQRQPLRDFELVIIFPLV